MLTGKTINGEMVWPSKHHDADYTNLYDSPTALKGGVVFKQTRTVRIVVGTAQLGYLLLFPKMAPLNDSNSLLITQGTFTGSTVVVANPTTGLARSPTMPTAPYGLTDQNYSYPYHISLSMLANSSSVTDRSGRIYMGYVPSDIATIVGANGTTLEGYQTFTTKSIASLSQQNMPKIINVPPVSSTRQYNGQTNPVDLNQVLAIVIEGAAAGTIYEFELKCVFGYTGSLIPWKQALVHDDESIQCVSSCISYATPKGNAWQQRDNPKIIGKVTKAIEHTAVRKKSFLSTLWEGAKSIWNGGLGDVVKTAVKGILL